MRELPILFLALTCYIGVLQMGFEGGYVSPTANSLIKYTPLTINILPIFAGFIFLGTLVMLPLLSFTSQTINSKALLIASIVPGCVGWFTVVLSNDVYTMLLGRFLLGIQSSILFLTSIYLGESSPSNRRRFYCSGIGLSTRFGAVLIYVLGIWMSFRWLAVTAIILELIFVCMLLLNPVSANWLVQQGLEERAKKSLRYFNGNGFDSDSEIFNMKQNNITKLSVREKIGQLSKWRVVKPILIITTLNNFKPLSGYPFIITFSSQILSKQRGLPPNIAALVLPIMILIGNILGQQIVSHFNLKKILISTTVLLLLSHLSMTIYFAIADYMMNCSIHDDVDGSSFCYTSSFWPILSTALYGISYGMGLDSVSYALVGEAFDANNRELSICILHTVGTLISIIVIVLFQYIFTYVGGTLTFGIFALFVISALPFEYYLINY
ncbi:Sugar transporter ERD6-like 6 [Oopsacas minuta]|uniref:Sugar transporter ERD6-like 6 n=1 Tax=Oopsacas minuta TaxID=111878 RepID=A0AAV7K907_9METZ|nr:Sugar transporter ERD6-like 6 [Oopsacas minuta]